MCVIHVSRSVTEGSMLCNILPAPSRKNTPFMEARFWPAGRMTAHAVSIAHGQSSGSCPSEGRLLMCVIHVSRSVTQMSMLCIILFAPSRKNTPCAAKCKNRTVPLLKFRRSRICTFNANRSWAKRFRRPSQTQQTPLKNPCPHRLLTLSWSDPGKIGVIIF